MKVWIAVSAMLISMLGTFSNAHALACVPASYVDYQGLGVTGCTIGDKTFSNFNFTLVGFSGGITVTPFLDNPNTSEAGDIGFGLTFMLAQVGPGEKDIGLIYDVSAPGPTITDAHLGFGGAATGGGVAVVSETVCPSGGPCQTDALLVFQTAAGGINTDFLLFDPVQSLHIRKDIGVAVFGDAGIAIISQVDQSFTQTTPEPATLFLLGSGLAGTGIFSRRLLRKHSSEM